MTTNTDSSPQQGPRFTQSTGVRLAAATKGAIYIAVSWPLYLAAFMLGVVLLPTGVALAPFGVGLPILAAALALAHGLAGIERSLQSQLLGRELPAPEADTKPKLSFRAGFDALRRPERLGEVLFLLLGWFFATITWSLALAWTVSALSFLLAPLWGALGHSYSGLGELLHLPGGGVVKASADVVAGLVLLANLPWAVKALTWAQSAVNAFLLEAPVRPLRARCSRT